MMYELALFAGAGGGILGSLLCGHTCIGAVEIEEYPREVLKQRQRDGILPRFPIWDDICTFRSDNPECAEYFDFLRSIAGELVISGGFPCQDISAAGKGAGIGGSRSGLWGEMARIIGEVRPRFAFVENSPLLVQRGLAVVLGDLAEMGYDTRWCVLGSRDVELPTNRARLWIFASAVSNGLESNRQNRDTGQRLGRPELLPPKKASDVLRKFLQGEDASSVRGMPHGVAHRVDRLKAIGNGQVPAVVELAWQILGGPSC